MGGRKAMAMSGRAHANSHYFIADDMTLYSNRRYDGGELPA